MTSKKALNSAGEEVGDCCSEPLMGIDLGTINSCVYVWMNGVAKLVPNEQGKSTTPSVVAFISGHRFIGDTAKSKMESYPAQTISEVKRLMGLRFREVSERVYLPSTQYIIQPSSDELTTIEVSDGYGSTSNFTPIEISAMILQKLKTDAEKFVRRPIKKAVITVPEHFNNVQRIATKHAAEIAGLEIICILNEPTAAALTYCYQFLDDEAIKYVLVYDLGGGTFDVSILNVGGNTVEVKKTKGNVYLGGIDFDHKLFEFCLQDIRKLVKDPNCVITDKESIQLLRNECEKAKCALTSGSFYEINFARLFENKPYSKKITKSQFNNLNHSFFAETIQIVKDVVEEAKMKLNDIDEVILVGGSSRIPKIQEMLVDLFGKEKLNVTFNADEAVANGAAIRAGISIAKPNERLGKMSLFDNSSWSIGVSVSTTSRRNVMKTLIARNSRLPASFVDNDLCSWTGQRHVEFRIFEGEHDDTIYNNLLGRFVLKGITPGEKLCVEGRLDTNGILAIKANDVISGASSEATINVTSHFSLNDEEIRLATERLGQLQQMYAEAETKVELKENLESLCNDLTTLVNEEETIPKQHVEAIEVECKNIQNWLGGTNIDLEPLSELSCKFTSLKRAINTSAGPIVEKKFIQMANMLGKDWWCGLCGEYNFANMANCIKCKTLKNPCDDKTFIL